MSKAFLDTIVAKTRKRIEGLKNNPQLPNFRRLGERMRADKPRHALRAALSQKDRMNVIAEIKRASPSRGVINKDIDPVAQAKKYVGGGAAAISVLTEPEYFMGSFTELVDVREAVTVPVLRKDFIIDECQVYETGVAAADAVLLIVAAMPPGDLEALMAIADHLGLDALVEIHTAEELRIAISAGASLIGVNNRDLYSLEVSLDVSRELIKHKPEGVLMVAESGISTRDEIDELRGLGFDGFLIGESLMRSPEILASLIGGAA